MTSQNTKRTFTDAQLEQLYSDLAEVLGCLPTGANKHDRAIVAIGVCIENGIDTQSHIVGTLMKLGFSNGHAGSVLLKSTGSNPDRHFWSRNDDGRYRNLDRSSTVPVMT